MRPASLYDLVCNLDDWASACAARDRETDPVTVDALEDEMAELATEHTAIRYALVRRFDSVAHEHI
ncbi:hypothetical protein [Streptomyces sp. NPDC002133]|uniref:hypothetical protein n=1 Tax=Streptomyces sp. NPDC002133 TaxID=3154409 RepID=UPI00333329A2